MKGAFKYHTGQTVTIISYPGIRPKCTIEYKYTGSVKENGGDPHKRYFLVDEHGFTHDVSENELE